MKSYNGSAVVYVAAAATTLSTIALTPTFDIEMYPKNDILGNTHIKVEKKKTYETAFDSADYYTYDDKAKINIIGKFVAHLTKEAVPLSAEDHQLIADNLFDLM